MNLSLVKIRHHKTEISIYTKDIHCRDSVIHCDTDSDTDSDSSDDSEKKPGTSSGSSGSSNPFGYIRYYNPQTGSEREESKSGSFVDHGEAKKVPSLLVSKASIHLQKQYSEESQDSTDIRQPTPYMACENLCNLNDSLELTTIPLPDSYIPTTRQSCPTKLVGNKFNQSSLTTIYIPTWSNSDNNITCATKLSPTMSTSSTTTHSSSLELPVNTLPLPDNVLAEILYNFDTESIMIDDVEEEVDDNDSLILRPPSMFDKDDVRVVPQSVSLNLENVGFRKHSINSDKPRRRSSLQITPKDSKDYPSTSHQSFCRCCMEYCHSPRSSDSGIMAGSCTLNSPDSANAADSTAQVRCSIDMANFFDKYSDKQDAISLSELVARDFESECQCTSPFGSTPRTSGQDCINENVMTGSRDSLQRVHSKLYVVPSRSSLGPQKSQSTGCLLDDTADVVQQKDEEDNIPMYKSGLYAHWWLKAKIPSSVVKGIYIDTRPANTGKGMRGGVLSMSYLNRLLFFY